MMKIHDNLELAYNHAEKPSGNNGKRVDAYMTTANSTNYTRLTIADIVKKVKHLSKKAV